MQALRSDKGFSLVEVMMVVAIIGLMTSAVVLMLPSEDTRLKDAAQGTERAFVAMARQSVLTGEPIGVRIHAEGFQPLKLTDDGWQPDDALLKPEALNWAPASAVRLEVVGADISFGDADADPQLWFLPTGEGPSFHLTLMMDTGQMVLSGQGNGRFEVQALD